MMFHNSHNVCTKFKHVLSPLISRGWKYSEKYVYNDSNKTNNNNNNGYSTQPIHSYCISLFKPTMELEEISITIYANSSNDFSCSMSLPIKQSIYNYKKKFSRIDSSYSLLENYIQYLCISLRAHISVFILHIQRLGMKRNEISAGGTCGLGTATGLCG